MAKKTVTAQVKIQVTGGQATPAPPVCTALGPHGVNIRQFFMQFNERTKEMKGTTIPVVVTIYNDRSFEFITKSPPASVLLKQAAQVAKGAANPKADKVGKVTKAQVLEIAKVKFSDMNSSSFEMAARVIAGTARSMGIEVTD
ncbi:MAG: 50S ribosomal protein L11 [Planctomycetes bacterium]|nr:50S ribosomal protein L11 [Planctomycetota bacterium]